MPYDDVKKGPTTWGAAARLLQKGEGKVTDTDIFGDDPLAPRKGGDPLDYLGHFAKDEVAEEGHNFGAPTIPSTKLDIKRHYDGDTAKRGYKVIPGNASAGYTERKTRAIINRMDSMLTGGTVPMGPIDVPTKMPLRKRDLVKSAAAGRGIGEATLRSKRK